MPIKLRSVRRQCSVPLCHNSATHIVSRTSAPAGASICLCDRCIKEIYEARFGADLTAHVEESPHDAKSTPSDESTTDEVETKSDSATNSEGAEETVAEAPVELADEAPKRGRKK